MRAVSFSGAGPPLAALNLTPKSSSMPPGLWLADRMKPPSVLFSRMRLDAAGVERIPPWPTITSATPLPAAILRMVWIAARLK